MIGWRARDRGASAVEFAILLPLLLLVIGGIVDFGRALFTEVIITNAAREGVRAAIFSDTASGADARASAAAPGRTDLTVAVTACLSNPAPSDVAKVVVSKKNFEWILLKPALDFVGGGGWLPTDLHGTAVMKCGG